MMTAPTDSSPASSTTPEVSTRLRPGQPLPQGFSWGATRCGLKQGRADLGLVVSEPAASAAACLTRNKVRAPCIDRNAGLVPSASVRAVLVNSGNANALTGPAGATANDAIASELAQALDTEVSQVLTASTGVIGVPLPADLLIRALPSLVAGRDSDPSGFAHAILTTDTCTKVAHMTVRLPGSDADVHLFGVAKGSGMIHPDMATTLGFICTDADIDPALLHEMLGRTVDDTFNAITVDGDTSTNDMVVGLANGAAGVKVTGDAAVSAMTDALLRVARPGVLDQHAAHHPRRHAEQVGTVLPVDLLAGETQQRLVDQRGRLQGVIGALAAQLDPGQPPQLVVDGREQLVERLLPSAAPLGEQAREPLVSRSVQARVSSAPWSPPRRARRDGRNSRLYCGIPAVGGPAGASGGWGRG